MDIRLIDTITEHICEEYGYNTPKIILDDNLTAFGRCYSNRRIVLNKSLCELNYIEIIEDLLKHEIIHLKYPNHGNEFETECGRMGISRHTRFDHPIIKTKRGTHLFRCSTCVIKSECNKTIRGCSKIIN